MGTIQKITFECGCFVKHPNVLQQFVLYSTCLPSTPVEAPGTVLYYKGHLPGVVLYMSYYSFDSSLELRALSSSPDSSVQYGDR